MLRSLLADSPVVLAPMEDVSDWAFRRAARAGGAGLCVTEFVHAIDAIHQSGRGRRKLDVSRDDGPTAIQIYGSDPQRLIEAARIAEASLLEAARSKPQNAAHLDINCGCWVPHVVGRGAGAGWLRAPDAMVAMARAIVAAVSVPVTVKTRIAFDAEPPVIVDLARRLEDAGVAAITLHCRTAAMGHKGAVDWSWAGRVREAVAIPVIVNGDIKTAEDVVRALRETGCAAAMIGRAAITHPWVFREARAALAGQPVVPPTDDERARMYVTLAADFITMRGEKYGLGVTRRHLALLGDRAAELRPRLFAAPTLAEVMEVLDVPSISDGETPRKHPHALLSMRRGSKPTVQVHHRGDRGVDGILRLIELAGHDGPMEQMLTAMCDELAAIANVDIASIYVRENDKLVMRGNHGFPATALGTTLDVGEGITGLVAECMRPISAAHAATNSAYKPVPGLGEEQFPVFVGVPLIAGGTAIGVLVLQRRASIHVADDEIPMELGVDDRGSAPHIAVEDTEEDPALFTQKEVTLATALGAPIMLAIERRLAAAMRSARLAGTGHISGAVLGRVGVIPTTTALGAPPKDLDKAFARLRDDQSRALKKLAHCDVPAVGAAFNSFALALCDARLRERIAEAAKEPDGMRRVAKQYARAAFKLDNVSRTAFKLDPIPESSEDIANLEELCVLLADPRSLHPGAVWIADRIHAFMAIAAVARGAAALVACDSVSLPAIAIARAASIPVVSDVPGLFGWARANDLVAVDGSTGTVLVHPSPMDIEKLRRARTE